MALSTVAALVTDPVAMFETAIACEVFGLDRTDDGVPPFTFMMCGETAGVPVPTTSGGALTPTHQWQDALEADLVVMPAGGVRDTYPEELLDVIRGAHARGATILSICTGAFVLGETGLLDGLTAVTHWRYAEQFAARFPRTQVSMDVLYLDQGQIVTGAGTAAGIDAVLHIVRRELGSTVATRIARRMVVPPQRDGGQRQYVEAPVPETDCESMQPVLNHIAENLDAPHTVPDLARLAMMSERTFARRFVAETGTTPHKWIVQQRVLRARELLESTDLPVESVASHSGFGSAALLRTHFQTVVGTSPQRYRREFSRA
ncbi:Transcriptional regulator GlxA family, contains an amidase domain and an AraC-type DNA-binding HTH domain [Pedococcus dokdonensis]|uniref:Transcriptional regulator GlxA family, contains an amidase domain and an AraC-type DNA-binding HTH domain n=1 Tax=Pedococcus dokdonensis TaxID=443156 RepID=A0A1H0LMA6_9MICO|nr:helix-turn-helix domain-containing protein [Pedococcus dokdonensis]SDO69348.1 Transcriptional regulator GlxA family, contains an amidase domain and an AraC-type DNA-binding HTH domain [Pedococcus dokdonensis]